MKKGQIDQFITSIVVIILVFFLMAFFAIASTNASKFLSASQEPQYSSHASGRSLALMEIFLSDKVNIDNTEMYVLEAISKLSSIKNPESTEEYSKYAFPIEKLFDEKYSCGQKNSLLMMEYVNNDATSFVKIFFDYPSNRVKENSRLTKSKVIETINYIDAKDESEGIYPQNSSASSEGYSTRRIESEKIILLTVKGDAC